MMLRLQAYKYELMPTGDQEADLRRFAGSCRFVFNKALAIQAENHDAGKKFINYVAMAKHLTHWRNSEETPWLKDAPCHPLQHALKDLDKAFQNFFAKRAGFPRFKRKGSAAAMRFPDSKRIRLDQSSARILLPKLGWMRYRKSREVLGEVRNVTVSQLGGKWFASIQTQREIEQPVPTATSAVGIDLGIAQFATLSDGSVIAPLNRFRQYRDLLARYQRRLDRKVKFSRNWRKAKHKVQRVHARIANARKDFLHKATTTISKNHALVCIEALQIKSMSASARGNAEQSGKNVGQKSGLNRAILDQGWGEFRRQLEYKLTWNGGTLLPVPAHHTSQTCPICMYVAKENRQSQKRFICVNCKHEDHADAVAAINILARGHRVLACGEMAQLDRSMKQEPSEATRRESRGAVENPVY